MSIGEIERFRDAALAGETEARSAAELLARFERSEEDDAWSPAEIGQRWSSLARRLRKAPGARKRELVIWGLSGAMAALALVLVWPHPTAQLPRTIAPAQPLAIPTMPALGLQASAKDSIAAGPWTTWPQTELGPNGTLWIEPGSAVQLPPVPAERVTDSRAGYAVRLDRGSLCAEVAARDLTAEGSFNVKTRQLDVTVIGTRFCVEAGPDLSSVSVERGRVRVSRAETAVVLEAGESIRSDSPRLNPRRPAYSVHAGRDRAAPGNPLAAPPEVPSGSLAGSLPGSLAAENDLYQRALDETRRQRHTDAAKLLADYLARFPTGLYAPEAGSGLAAELELAGQPSEAVAAARERLRAFPRDPHDWEVKLRMASVLRERLGRPADALMVYEELLAAPGGSGRAEALFGLGLCRQRLGNDTTAREAWRRYQAEDPGGPHAAEVERLLGE